MEILETQASSNILPPQIDLNSIDPTLLPDSEDYPQYDKSTERRNAYSGESSERKGFLPPPTGFEPPRILPNHNAQFRQQEETRLRNLGLPLQNPTQTTKFTQKSASAVQQTIQGTKKPARTFDPDKNFKAFDHFFPSKKATHKDYDFSQYFTRKNNAVTTPSPRRQFNSNNNAAVANKNQLPVGPNTQQRPFVNNHFNQQKSSSLSSSSATTTRKSVTTPRPTAARTSAPTVQTATNAKKTPLVTRSPSYYQPQARSNQPQPQQLSINQNQINSSPSQPSKTIQQQQQPQGQKKIFSAPANDLLPPHETIKLYDDSTTRGPPIYYEWRVPDDSLLPPKFDNETDTNSKRSIPMEGNFENDFQSSESRRYSGSGNSIKIQYKDLQKVFAIPDVEFNLESSGREGYDDADAVNSFQVKIPYRKDVGKSSVDRYYYLEHGHCNPECHPYFFKPGRCEPCIKLKKK